MNQGLVLSMTNWLASYVHIYTYLRCTTKNIVYSMLLIKLMPDVAVPQMTEKKEMYDYNECQKAN